IPYRGVFCYLSAILDACTKQVLAYVLSPSLELDFVLETVHILIQKHGVSLDAQTLVHSDQGCHDISLRFIQILKDSSLRQSMSRRDSCVSGVYPLLGVPSLDAKPDPSDFA
ncbi:MAG: hypothetical protein HFF17_16680, partial [Oscillospiraceae bacterium]|nr:hypothetical protein [Oscillospiraceae bacterium]